MDEKGRGKGEEKRKGMEKEVKEKRTGEMRRRQTERKGRKRERKEKKETGGILCFFS